MNQKDGWTVYRVVPEWLCYIIYHLILHNRQPNFELRQIIFFIIFSSSQTKNINIYIISIEHFRVIMYIHGVMANTICVDIIGNSLNFA